MLELAFSGPGLLGVIARPAATGGGNMPQSGLHRHPGAHGCELGRNCKLKVNFTGSWLASDS